MQDVAKQACFALCEQVKSNGCIDTASQTLMLLFMTLSPEDVSKIRVGKLTPYSIQYLGHLKEFFGVTFKIRADRSSQSVLLSCLGLGYKNVSKKVT